MLKIGNVYQRELGTVYMFDRFNRTVELNLGESVVVLNATQLHGSIGSYVKYEVLFNNEIYYCSIGGVEEINPTIYWSLIC